MANVRGRGLLIGFDLVSDPERKTPLAKDGCVRFFKDCLAEGVIAMSYTPRVRIHPPLVLTADEATHALAVLDGALERLDGRT
jgi:4-aminobutyrate aminotransferase-like enzyme